MRNLFSDWFRGDYAWVIAPLGVWMVAWLLNTLVQMIRRRRLLHPLFGDRQAGWVWKATFLAVVVWGVGWTIWLGAAPEGGQPTP